MPKLDDRTHYAVVHPDDPDRHVYWVVNAKGVYRPWPPRITLNRHYDPDGIQWKTILEEITKDRKDASRTFFTVRDNWIEQCLAQIREDPIKASLDFSSWSIRCWACAKALTDPVSKTRGIGPDCQQGVPDRVIDRLFVPAVAKARRAA